MILEGISLLENAVAPAPFFFLLSLDIFLFSLYYNGISCV